MTDRIDLPPSKPEADTGADDLALRGAAVAPFDVASATKMRGSGWEGDLSEMRAGRRDASEPT